MYTTDKSLHNSKPRTISDALQNFIDSMVEEIVLEGKPFDTQKKYLQKFCENEGVDYNKLEANIKTFSDILDSLKTSFNDLMEKLAREKGEECHISEEMMEKLMKCSSRPREITPQEYEITFEQTSLNTAKVTGISLAFSGGELVIPSEVIMAKSVLTINEIANRAFMGNGTIEKIIVPESVTAIGSQAFSDCRRLNTLVIPNSVDSIASDVLIGSHWLANLTIPSWTIGHLDEDTFTLNHFLSDNVTITNPDGTTSKVNCIRLEKGGSPREVIWKGIKGLLKGFFG